MKVNQNGKANDKRQTRENVQSVLSAEKKHVICTARENIATGAKGGKTCSWCRARENMKPVPNAGKHVAGAECGKTWFRCWAREKMQPIPSAGITQLVPSAGKHVATNQCQVRANMQPVPSAGKHVSRERVTGADRKRGNDVYGANRGKTCSRCQVRENSNHFPSAGKYVTVAKFGKMLSRPKRGNRVAGTKRVKTCYRCQARNWIWQKNSRANFLSGILLCICFLSGLISAHEEIILERVRQTSSAAGKKKKKKRTQELRLLCSCFSRLLLYPDNDHPIAKVDAESDLNVNRARWFYDHLKKWNSKVFKFRNFKTDELVAILLVVQQQCADSWKISTLFEIFLLIQSR